MNNWQADDPNIGPIAQPGVAFVFNGALYYFGTEPHKKRAFFAGMDTTKLDPTYAQIPIPSAKLWSSANAQVDSSIIETDSGVATAVMPASVYTFWRDPKLGVMAANWTSDSLALPLSQVSSDSSFVLQDSKGNSISAISDVAASALDQNHILMGTITDAGVYIALFSPAGSGALPPAGGDSSTKQFPWPATSSAEWIIPLSRLQSAGTGPEALGSNLSLEWYSVDGSNFCLAFSLFDGANAYVYWLHLDIISLPYATLGRLPTDDGCDFYSQVKSFAASTPISIKRDMAGRLNFYWATNSRNGAALNSMLQPPGQPAVDSFVPNTYTPLDSKLRPFKEINFTPAGAFVQSSVSQSVTITNDPNIGGNTTYPAFAAAQVVFADNKGELCVMSAFCGALQQLNHQPDDDRQHLQAGTIAGPGYLVLRGIIDGPIPIPNENTMPYKFPGGFPSNAGNLTYGSDETKTKSSDWDFSLTMGMKSTGGPTKGVGPAWNISLTGGMGVGGSQSSSTQTLDNASQPATLLTDQSIERLGTLVGYGISIQYNLFRLLQRLSDGTYQVDPSAPQFTQIMPFYSGSASLPFTPYDVTPGQLQSYTREAWNSRMQQLGYPGSNYFEDVVIPNAVVFDEGNPFLDFSWAKGGGTQKAQFHASEDASIDSSWTFTADIWVGFGEGEEISMFGFGEGMQAQYLLGTTIKVNGSSQQQTEQGWGITLDSYWCPDPPAEGSGFDAYAWRVYFLPASSRWLQEFLTYGGPANVQGLKPGESLTIDPTSKPWRIVYEVVSYSPTTTQSYPASDKNHAPTPEAPSIMTWSLDLLPNGPFWKSGSTVSYALSFISGEVESNWSEWSTPTEIYGYMCPELSVPTDQSGWASARRVYRQIDDGAPQLVGTILDNSVESWIDGDPQWNFPSPPKLDAPYGGGWQQRSNSTNSQVWIPNQVVQYALTYVFDGLETQLGPWSDQIVVDFWANPTFTNVPVFPDPGIPNFPPCTGRNLYRQCLTQTGQTIQKATLVAQLNDNTTTTMADPEP